MRLFRGSFLMGLVGIGSVLGSTAFAQQPAPAGAATPTLNSAPPTMGTPSADSPSSQMSPATLAGLREAVGLVRAGNFDPALTKLNALIKADPKSVGAYVLRAAVYSQKKMWLEAEADFKTAHQLDPANPTIKFNLGEVHFVQKKYDLARVDFAELQKDSDLGDLASYKVFLCDLFGGHEDVAARELAVFNQVGSKPSYYFSNAAWCLVHHNTEEAKRWMNSAINIYAAQKNNIYAQSLKDLGYLPLPSPSPLAK